MAEKKESQSELTKRLIREKHPDSWLIEFASIGTKLNINEYGAFTVAGLITYELSNKKQLIKTGELTWPEKKHGEVDHFAIKSVFYIDGAEFITGNHGKDVQRYLENEKKDTFTKVIRPFYQKIPGFRSRTKWKMITAGLIYLMLFSGIVDAFTDEEDKKPKTQPTVVQEQTKTPAGQTPPVNKETQEVEDTKFIAAIVTKVVDGDTLDVKINGKDEKVRMLLVDTPETKHPDKPVQPFGPEASAFVKKTIEGKEIQLERDTGDARDKYGRLLYYVNIDGKSVQEMLLEKGLARVAYVIPPNVKYVDKYREIQKTAQSSRIGIWSIENYASENGFNDEAVKKKETAAKPQTTPKPAAEPKKEVPSVQETPAPEPKQEVFYKNCAAVRAAGAAPIHRGDPGYSSKLDKDGDGVACE